MRKYYLLFVIIFFIGCQNKKDVILTNQEFVWSDNYSFIYEGEFYSTGYIDINDSTRVYENKEIGSLIENLDNNDSISLLITPYRVQYIKNSDINNSNIVTRCQGFGPLNPNIPVSHIKNSKRTNVPLILFEDANFEGENIAFETMRPITNLKDYIMEHKNTSWNDKTSSIAMSRNIHVVFYRDTNFKGKRLIFSTEGRHSPDNPNPQLPPSSFPNAEKYPQFFNYTYVNPFSKKVEANQGGNMFCVFDLTKHRLKSGKNWNDRISSITMGEGTIFQCNDQGFKIV